MKLDTKITKIEIKIKIRFLPSRWIFLIQKHSRISENNEQNKTKQHKIK